MHICCSGVNMHCWSCTLEIRIWWRVREIIQQISNLLKTFKVWTLSKSNANFVTSLFIAFQDLSMLQSATRSYHTFGCFLSTEALSVTKHFITSVMTKLKYNMYTHFNYSAASHSLPYWSEREYTTYADKCNKIKQNFTSFWLFICTYTRFFEPTQVTLSAVRRRVNMIQVLQHTNEHGQRDRETEADRQTERQTDTQTDKSYGTMHHVRSGKNTCEAWMPPPMTCRTPSTSAADRPTVTAAVAWPTDIQTNRMEWQ